MAVEGPVIESTVQGISTTSLEEAGLSGPPSEGGAGRLVVIAHDLLEEGIEIDDIGLRRPTLDDVFLTLTGRPAEEAQAAAEAIKDAGKGRGRAA